MSGGAIRMLLLALLAACVSVWFLSRPQPLAPADLPAHLPNPSNGALMFTAGGCASCHGEDLEGGFEMPSPFGLFRAPNISPDDETGIGAWSTLDFVNAMKRGVAPDGRHYYPAFPFTSYARMRPEDLIDLKAYIDTLPPVSHSVPDHELSFPWNQRWGIGLWKRLYLDPAPVLIGFGEEAVIERGRYLVEGPGHCAECHTPRDAFGGLRTALWMAGGRHPEGEGKVPNITPHADGLASWSANDIAYYLESGFTPDYDMVGGSMVKVQEHLANLPDSDRVAIAAYLKALPPIASAHD